MDKRFRKRMSEMMKREGKLISYLQNTSHQMRTPMTLIRSYTELILADLYGPLEEGVREKMETISNSLEEMNYFVDQIEDIGYISNGGPDPEPVQSDIRDIVEKMTHETATLARSRSVQLEMESDGHPCMVRLDDHFARRAVQHLFRYVVSTAPHGSSVRIALKPGKDRTLVIVFGFGQVLDQEQMAGIVSSMSATEARLTTMEWEQLSLPITKAMMEMQGGDLTIFEDEKDRTVYVLEFPRIDD
jgi:K+-sensing histidine kinase KdpD